MTRLLIASLAMVWTGASDGGVPPTPVASGAVAAAGNGQLLLSARTAVDIEIIDPKPKS